MALRFGFRLCGSFYKGNRRGLRVSASQLKIVQFDLSDIGEGIREVTVRDWYVKVGDRVKQFDDICSVESDKAAVNITSRFDGVVTRIYHEEGAIARVGQPLVDIDTDGEADEPVPVSEPVKSVSDVPVQKEELKSPEKDTDDHFELGSGFKALTTPAVRRMAKEHKISLSDVKGSGKSGRVLKEDLLNYLELSKKPKILSIDSTGASGGDRTVPLVGIKKVMAKTMTESHNIPSFGFSDEFDVSKLVVLRKEIKEQLQNEGVNVTYLPFFIKALSNSLLKYPEINAHVDAACENLLVKSEHNIGLAVDTPNGLLVPNIKGVEKMSVLEISAYLNDLIKRSKDRSLSVKDLTGGTITISNIGIVGGTYLRPLINPPEVAIVGLGKFRRKPVFDANDKVVAADTCNISWSVDHRVIDGATLARFSQLWKTYLENPLKLLIET